MGAGHETINTNYFTANLTSPDRRRADFWPGLVSVTINNSADFWPGLVSVTINNSADFCPGLVSVTINNSAGQDSVLVINIIHFTQTSSISPAPSARRAAGGLILIERQPRLF